MDEPRELDIDALALLAELTSGIEPDIQPGEITAADYRIALARQGTNVTGQTAEDQLQRQVAAGLLQTRLARVNGRPRRVWRKTQ